MGTETNTDEGMPCEYEDRNQGDASISQGTPKKPGESHEYVLLHSPQKEQILPTP